jgi:tetratricopeptide (TPR) repeat protein
VNGVTQPNRILDRRAAALAGLCAAAVVACYVNGLGNGFCEDDNLIIALNPLVTEPGQWGSLWRKDYWHRDAGVEIRRDLLYRPVAILTYRLDHAVHGLRPFGYHLVNLLLHVAVTLLVYRLGLRMTGSIACAALAGCGFAVLPIHVEAVTHVVGRAELLVALFTLLALRLVEPAARPRTVLRSAAAGLCVFLALGSKETGIAAVLLVPLFDLYWRRIERNTRSSCPTWACWIAVAAAGAVYVGLRQFALGGKLVQSETPSVTVNFLVDAAPMQRIWGLLQLWGMYWAKTFWPQTLVFDYTPYAVHPAEGILHPHVLLGLAVAAAMIGVAVVAFRGRGSAGASPSPATREGEAPAEPPCRAGRSSVGASFSRLGGSLALPAPALWTAALLVSYAPVSNVFFLVKTTFAERVWYFPSVWVMLLTSWLVCIGLPGWISPTPGRARAMRRILLAPAVVLLLLGWGRCWLRNPEWRDNGTLFASAYRDHPRSTNVLLCLGSWLAYTGRPQEAIETLNQALLIDWGNTRAHRQIGQALLEVGRPRDALRHLATAEAQLPGHPDTLAALEKARARVAAEDAGAVAQLESKVAEAPDDLDALLALVDRLADSGRYAEAADRLRDAESRFADNVRYLHRLAVAVTMAGRQDEGVAAYRRAVGKVPDNPAILVELAMLLLDRRADGDMAEAEALIDRAAHLDPNNVQVQIARAERLVLQGRLGDAAGIYRRLAAMLPRENELADRCRLRAEFLER